MSETLRFSTAHGAWTVASPLEKLALRSRLPGAYAFDRAAEALAHGRSDLGLEPFAQLPLALPASWLVNNAVTSPVFRKWLTPPLVTTWDALVDALSRGDLAPVEKLVAELGAGAGGPSKVLALLLPDVVPLMPDAAIAFAVGGVTSSASQPDAQTAPAERFVPMSRWFAETVRACEPALAAVASREPSRRLSAAQVLDRLLWFESSGFKHFKGWTWVSTAHGQAVVEITEPRDPPAGAARVDLDAEPEGPWKSAALGALSAFTAPDDGAS